MKIIILGRTGRSKSSAESYKEASDITVVDKDSERLRELQDKLDIQTIRGMASHPILKQAGAEEADMLIAVTSSDEVNMVACQVAHTVLI